jgi:hypothetical protein
MAAITGEEVEQAEFIRAYSFNTPDRAGIGNLERDPRYCDSVR